MNLGSITLRLHEEHFKNIADTMQIAIHQFMHYKTSHIPCPEFAASKEQHKPNWENLLVRLDYLVWFQPRYDNHPHNLEN